MFDYQLARILDEAPAAAPPPGRPARSGPLLTGMLLLSLQHQKSLASFMLPERDWPGDMLVAPALLRNGSLRTRMGPSVVGCIEQGTWHGGAKTASWSSC